MNDDIDDENEFGFEPAVSATGASAAYAPPQVNRTASSTPIAASGCRRRLDRSRRTREPRDRPGNDLGTSLLVT